MKGGLKQRGMFHENSTQEVSIFSCLGLLKDWTETHKQTHSHTHWGLPEDLGCYRDEVEAKSTTTLSLLPFFYR